MQTELSECATMGQKNNESGAETVLYRTNFGSGYSWKSIFSKIGSTNNCLRVVLSPSMLTIDSSVFLFRPILNIMDMLHEIPLDRLRSVQRTSHFRFKITFSLPDGEERIVTLMLWSPAKFVSAMNEAGVSVAS